MINACIFKFLPVADKVKIEWVRITWQVLGKELWRNYKELYLEKYK